mgnify:CR=1 FL=1
MTHVCAPRETAEDITRDITPVEAGMARAFAKKEQDFVGANVLRQRAEEGPQAQITCRFLMTNWVQPPGKS